MRVSNDKQDNKPQGTITLQLSTVSSPEASKAVIDNALQGIDKNGVDHLAAAAESEPVQLFDAIANADPQQTDFLKALGKGTYLFNY